jgi:hypothetical protein
MSSFLFNFDEPSPYDPLPSSLNSGGGEDTVLDKTPIVLVPFDLDAPVLTPPSPDTRLVKPGIYEGGGTIWEASLFLASYLRERPEIFKVAHRVADLGCGAAILAREALRSGIVRQILLTDLNSDVLYNVASPLLRSELAESQERISSRPDVFLVAGSWNSLNHAIQTHNCLNISMLSEIGCVDLILSSETLYRPSHLPSFCALLFHLLHPLHGVALLATKRFYYGAELGGGTSAFLSVASTFKLSAEVIHSKDDGSAMILDIIRVVR